MCEEELGCPHAGTSSAAPWGGSHDPHACAPLRVICALHLDFLAVE
jgi:hypothetical protein